MKATLMRSHRLLAFVVLAGCSASNQIGTQLDGGGGASGTGGAAGASGAAGSSGGAAGSVGAAGSSGGAAGSVGAAGSSGGAAGSVGAAGSSGGAAGSVGAAGSTGAAGAGAAGSGAGGIQPRALIVDPGTTRFVAYDRNGQIVHDYQSRLDLGAGYTGRAVIANGRLFTWDGGPNLGGSADPPFGLAEPLEPSRILIRGEPSPGVTTKVRMFGADNQSASDLTVTSNWRQVEWSPRHGYLYATKNVLASAPDLAAVIRVSDGATIFSQQIVQGMFARDDSHFTYVPIDRGIPVRVLDLATRADTTPALTQPAFATQPGVWAELVASTSDRAVILTTGVNKFGRLLWAMNWQTKVDRIGAGMPQYTDESFWGFSPSGDKVMWARQTNGLDGNPAAYVGAYQMDFATLTSSAFTGQDVSCFEHPNDVWFRYVSGTSEVQSCACGTGTCTTIGTVPAFEPGWAPTLIASANRRVVVIGYGWALNRLPTTAPEIKCLSATGQVLASVPYGQVEVDATGQMVLLRESAPNGTGSYRVGIVDLATGALTWVGSPAGATIVYE